MHLEQKNPLSLTESQYNKIGNIIIAIAFIMYVWAILKFTSFMPMTDDYGVVLKFLNQYEVADFTEKIKLLFSQHNEHRLVFNKIVEVLQLKIFGEVNFLYLSIIGNLGWILVVYMLWRIALQNKVMNTFSFAPIALIMFSFAHGALITWPMASLQQYWQMLFSLFAILLLTYNQYYKSWIFMILSIFTSGGGLTLVPLFGLYHLIYKNWKQLGITIILSIIVLLLYFVILDYDQPGRRPSLLTIISNPEKLMLYILVFLGNFGDVKDVALVFGTILVGLFLFKIKIFFKKVPFIAWSILFILLTAFLTGVSRSGFGIKQALSSRYAIYSLLFASLVYYGYVVIYKNNKKIVFAGLFIALSLFIYYFIHIVPAFEQRKHKAETRLAIPSIRAAYAENILKRSAQLNIFTSWLGVKTPSFLENLPELNGTNEYCIGIAEQVKICNGKVTQYYGRELIDLEVHIFGVNKILVDGWVFDSVNNTQATGVMVVLGDNKKVFYLDHHINEVHTIPNSKYENSSLRAEMTTLGLKDGQNILEIRTINTFGTGYYDTLKIPIKILNLDDVARLPVVDTDTRGNIDTFSVSKNKIKMSGWYVDINSQKGANPIIIDIDGKKYLADYGISRADVAQALKNNYFKNSGFLFELDTESMKKGQHTIQVYVLSNDSRTLYKTHSKRDFIIK